IGRRGAVTGLITTAGFADTLEIGRERKFELYDLNIAKPEPLVPRNLGLEVRERLRADGSVEVRLDGKQVAQRAQRLIDAGVTSIAIVFLHAYANGKHEAAAAGAITRRHRQVAVTTSHEVAPEIREYERASTTVANAYIKPLARRYLDAMARRARGGGGLAARIAATEPSGVGAGGGSLVAVVEIGLLRVVPRSAGSHPGAASYGVGGSEPTVTDADFLLGYLNPAYFAGGEV